MWKGLKDWKAMLIAFVVATGIAAGIILGLDWLMLGFDLP